MFKIYSSSAGSGKTYTLTREYLKLALQPGNDSYYRHILAVTFTNAAAQEMKDRILGTLRAFAAGEEHPMIRDIVTEHYPDDDALTAERINELRQRASKLFTRILHGYSDFSVMTIDSFMSKLVGSFTDELGLPFGFETRLDSDLLAEAIERLLSRIGLTGEETLTSLLEHYYLEHAREEGAWGALRRQMQAVAGDLLSEQSYQAMTRVSDLSLTDWQHIRRQLVQFVREKEDSIRETASGAVKIIADNGLAAGDFFQSSRGIFGFFTARALKNSTKFWEAPNSYVIRTIEEEKWGAAKLSRSAQEAMLSVAPALTDAFVKAEHIRREHTGLALLYKSLAGQLYNLSLLNEIKREFDLLLRQNNQVHISEFNRKVIEIVANDPVPFIFERLGEKYNHILIDEFQDTSKLQFANLLPLIDNALSSGFFNLIVGDVKQAIYRFRGGDMELLLKLSSGQALDIAGMFGRQDPFMRDRVSQLSRNTTLARLSTNRRSYCEITTFNNLFFAHLSASVYAGTPLTKAVYDENAQQETGPLTPKGGHVSIEFLDKEKDESEPEEAFDTNAGPPDPQGTRLLELIAELHAEGYLWRDIAILCRYKKDAAKLAIWLQKAGLPLISDDSLLLANSSHVALIIRFIRVVHAPDNTQQRLETALLLYRLVLRAPVNGLVMAEIVAMSKEPGLASFLNWLSEQGIVFDASELYQLGIYEMCEQIIARLPLPGSKTENQYLFRFLDEVLKFETTRVSHPGDFLNWWDAAGVGLSITAPAETDAIRITTIHKSKGLEYPVVLLPYADWKVGPKSGSRLWLDLAALTDPSLSYEGRRLLSAAVPITKKLEETVAAAQYQEEVDKVLLENINLAYVGFTRAIQRLYILAAMPRLSGEAAAMPAPAVNYWLQDYLVGIGEWSDDTRSYTLYEAHSQPAHAHRRPADHVFTLWNPRGNKEATTLSLKKNADKVFHTETFERERDFGQKIKQVLIRMPSVAKLEETIRKDLQAGIFRPDEVSYAFSKINRLLSIPPISTLFSEDAQKVSNQIIRNGGEIVEADRVVRAKDGGYAIMLFGADSPSSRARMTRLMELANQTGLPKLCGYLLDIEAEKLVAV